MSSNLACSSGLGSTLSMSGSSLSDKHLHMKQFISTALEFNRTRAESCANQLNRHLQIIGVVIDLSTFDPHSSVVAEFYVSLHELMSGLESRSSLLWGGINVLQQACKNRAAHHALIHTYHFLPILSRLLGDQLTREKKMRLLTLIQELTYGIRITWQEPHIPHLIATVVKWITTNEPNVVNLSLNVLINLCYKNLPAIYTLMRCVDTKVFMRTVMSLEGTNIDVQICKLLIILENINGEVPRKDILKFVAVTFDTVADAFRTRDVVLLRHIVDFFIDVKVQHNQRAAFADFKNYAEHIQKIIKTVDNSGESGDQVACDPECMGMLFEFLLALVQLNIADVVPLHPKLAQLALGWVQTDHASSQALGLLRCVATAKGVDTERILRPLADGLQVLLIALDSGCGEEDTNVSAEYQTRLTGLFHLLREMVKCTTLRDHVVSDLKEESVRKIFSPLMGMACTPRNRSADNDAFSEEATLLYVHALALVRELSSYETRWKAFYTQLMESKQIHMIIAHAFCKGDVDTKILIFDIAKTVEFRSSKIAAAFAELQPLTDFGNSVPNSVMQMNDHVPYTIMSFGQEEKLDNLILKLQEAVTRNQIANVATSDVMELFEYKMAAMGHAERAAQASLEAAGKQAAHLQHRLAQMSAESSRLHQMLFHSQQCQEDTGSKLLKVEESMRQSVIRLAKAKTQCSEYENQLKSCQTQLQVKTNELRVHEEKIQTLTGKYQELFSDKGALEVKLQDQMSKNNDLCKMVKKMEDRILDMDKKLEEKKQNLLKATQKISTLTDEVNTYEKVCKRNEEQISQKEKEYVELQAELDDYKSKLDWIVQISMNKVKNQS